MVEAGSHVFLDTNVIIEAHRVNAWRAICGQFRLDTVMRCIEELNTGRRRPVTVDTDEIIVRLAPKEPSPQHMTILAVRYPESVDMDDGEKEILAYVLSLQPNTFFICSPDKALIRAAYALDLIDRYLALEHLTESAGLKPDIEYQYTKAFLGEYRTKLLLEME